MTELMYQNYPHLFEATGRVEIKGSDEKGSYLVFDRTIFYPQGGGQPADKGSVKIADMTYEIYDVRNIDGEVRHYVTGENCDLEIGDKVNFVVDEKRRRINSKYHTAGHLIAVIVEKEFLNFKATKGHQFPGEAYVEFAGDIDAVGVENLQERLAGCIDECIGLNLGVKMGELDDTAIVENLLSTVPKNKYIRACFIEKFPAVPCGGTHVEKLKEIGSIIIRKCKNKKDRVKIYYEVLE